MATIDQLKCGGKVKGRKKKGGIIRFQDGGETGIPDKIDFSKMTFDPQERFQYEGHGFTGKWDAVAKKGNYKYFPDTYDTYGGGVKQKPGDAYIGTYNRNKYYASPREGATPNVRKRVMSMLHPGSGVRGRKLNNDFSRKELQGIWDNQDSNRLDEFIKYLYPEKIKSRVPKMHDGGGIPSPTNLLNTSGNPSKKGMDFNAVSAIAGMATDVTDAAFDSGKDKVQSDYDIREDPTKMMNRSNALDTGKALAKGAAAGAAIGSVIPVIGTAIGAIGGTITAGIVRLIGKRKRDRETDEAQNSWRSGWTDTAASYANQSGYKEGGKIKGKGGPKSDSIKMDAKDGSFIVPTENAETGMDIGKTYLGWNDKTMADRKNKGSEIAVSDGEVFYTPEEVGMLKYYGINLDELAPNAKSEHKMKDGGTKREKRQNKRMDEFKIHVKNSEYNEYLNNPKGMKQKYGLPDNMSKEDFDKYIDHTMKFNNSFVSFPEAGREWSHGSYADYVYEKDNPGKMSASSKRIYGTTPFLDKIIDARLTTHNLGRVAVKEQASKFQKEQGAPLDKFSTGGEKTPTDPMGVLKTDEEKKREKREKKEKEGNERNVFDLIPEIAGTLQMLGGAYGLREAGKKPDLQISHTLKKLSAETRRLANFGYEPAVLNALNTQIEKSRRDMTKAVTTRGGSPQENMEKMKMILSTTLDKKAGVVFQDAKEKARKWADVIRVDTIRSGQEFDVNKIDLADWYKTQDVFANLMSSGIENVIGARQLKAQQDVIREVGSASPSFTLK